MADGQRGAWRMPLILKDTECYKGVTPWQTLDEDYWWTILAGCS